MPDACYLCRRTQADLDRLNEETRTRVYLSYFSNARGQLDEQLRRINFLQRIKDDEGADPHLRIPAQQIFGDPAAYKKLMPWIDTVIEIAGPGGARTPVTGTIGELVERLLGEERAVASGMELGLNELRGGFPVEGHSPLALRKVTVSLPVGWTVDGHRFAWHTVPAGEAEPLHRPPGSAKATADVELHLCAVCEKLLGKG